MVFLVIVLFYGVLVNVFYLLVVVYVNDYVLFENYVKVLGGLFLFYGFGMVIGLMLGGLVMVVFGFYVFFVIILFVYVVIIIYVVF